MSEHTPEPWRTCGCGDCDIVWGGPEEYELLVHDGPDGSEVSIPNHKERVANARRIVACVNACAGMKDPAAEIKRLRALEVAKSDQAKAAKYLSSLAGFVTTLGGFAPVPLNADWREVQRKANEEFEARVKNAPTNGDPRSGYDAEGNMRGCFDPTGKFWPFLFIPGQPFGSRREIERGEGRILDACPVNPENMAPPEPPSTLPDPVL